MFKFSKRRGLFDIWNAFMCEGASFSDKDIPYCPTIMTDYPETIITWEEALRIYRREYRKNNSFHIDAFVCFYIDDQKFDGVRNSIWLFPKRALKILKHFNGIITPDFSTYQDFPYPIKIYNTYRMRTFGYWVGCNGLEVINNSRWGTEESYDYCFDGLPQNSIIAIGTVGGGPRNLIDRKRFENGLFEMVKRLNPHTITVYGSANYECFEILKNQGINVISYEGKTCESFRRRRENNE